MAKRKVIGDHPSAPGYSALGSGDQADVKINVAAGDVLLGRVTTGEGAHEEIVPASLTEDTTLSGDDAVIGWNASGNLRKFKAGAFAGGGDILNGGNTTGATVVIGTNDANALSIETNNVVRATLTGGASTGGALTLTDVTANTATVEDAVTIQTNSSGTAAAGFGGAIKFQGESSTTNSQDMARISSLWTTATHASRASALTFSTVTGAGSLTERMRILGTGYTGINNTAPASQLSIGPNITGSPVYGLSLVGSSGNDATAGFQNTDANGYSGFLLYDQSGTYSASVQFGNSGTYLANAFFFGNRLASGPMHIISGPLGDIRATMLTDGRFGFGTQTPTARLHVVQTAAATGALTGIVYTGAVNTNQTLSTEIPSLTLTTAGRQWATGALTTQREVLITQPTYSFVGASTITNAATLGIAGAPIKSTNATITNTHGILVQAGAVSTATNSYGLTVNAQTGATNNYAAQFMGGNVGIGVAAPTAKMHLAAGTSAASTAPIKFTAGTNLTAVEDGAIEFDGTEYYASSGGTRYTLSRTLKGSATLDFASTTSGNVADLTITVTGAADGDAVALGVPNAAITTTSSYTAWVSSANTVTVRFSPKGTEDPASGTFKVTVFK